MNFWLLALKNLRRKLSRTILTIGGVAVAVAVMVSLLGFDAGYKRALQRDVERMGYHLLVTAKGCPYEAATLMLKGGGGLRYMDQAVYEKIVKDERVDSVCPQLVSTVFDSEADGGRGSMMMFMGILESYLRLKPWATFHSGGWFSSEDADEVIMGYEAAELEQRSVGDEIFIPGIDKVLKVQGIFERTGTQDDGVVFLSMKSAQRIFDQKDRITGIGIKLRELGDLMDFEEDLYDEPGIQVVSMAQVKGTILNLMASAQVLTYSVAIVAVFVSVIGVINTVLMSVFERTKEIGVMKALGASRLQVFRLIWTETVIVCLIGGLLGEGLAMTAARLVEIAVVKVLPYAPPGPLVLILPSLLGKALIGAILAGLFAGLYPAWRASSTHPVQAIRSGE